MTPALRLPALLPALLAGLWALMPASAAPAQAQGTQVRLAAPGSHTTVAIPGSSPTVAAPGAQATASAVPVARATAAASPETRSASARPPGSPDNSPDHRRILVERILPDLRVFVDLRPGQMPWNRLDGELGAEEVRQAVALGIGNWASVLPGMRFRLVDSDSLANLVIRFRDYRAHIPGGSSAVAFLPGGWRPPAPDPAAPDFACGAEEFGRLPSGEPCRETSHNMILFQSRMLAFRRVHFVDPRLHQEYLEAKADRKDPAKRFFRLLPDPRYGVWPPDRSTCIAGAPVGGVLPAWDVQCLTDADWEVLPHFGRLGPVEGPYDIASLVQHEVGHTLLGDHTGAAVGAGGCHRVAGTDFEDFRRDPVYTRHPMRLLEWTEGSGAARAGYSILFSGNSLDAALNVRGVFEADAMRLAGGALDGRCLPIGPWKGFATSYPKASGWIVLQRPGGETKYVDDWRYAQRLMGWPLAGGGPAAGDWFQTGLLPK